MKERELTNIINNPANNCNITKAEKMAKRNSRCFEVSTHKGEKPLKIALTCLPLDSKGCIDQGAPSRYATIVYKASSKSY